jgi:hypothetical protein
MTASQSLNLYNIAIRYFKNEADAISFVKAIELVVDNKFEIQKDNLASKLDINNMRVEMKDQKSEIIKWMFIFWASRIAATIGFIMMSIRN